MDVDSRVNSRGHFLRKAILALVGLFLGMLVVIGSVWLLNNYFNLGISSGVRNIIAVALGVFISNRIIGKDLQEQYEIQRAKNERQSTEK